MTDTTTLERTTASGAGATLDHWVNGAAWAGSSQRSGPVYNPALGTVQREVRLATASDVDEAVGVASPPHASPPRAAASASAPPPPQQPPVRAAKRRGPPAVADANADSRAADRPAVDDGRDAGDADALP